MLLNSKKRVEFRQDYALFVLLYAGFRRSLLALIGIESKVFTVVINLVVGIVLGCQPIIGYNIGAKKLDRVFKLYRAVLLCTVVIGVVSTLLFELAPSADAIAMAVTAALTVVYFVRLKKKDEKAVNEM